MARLTIDGREVTVADGATLLDAITAAGGEIPALCNDPRIAPAGACRTCIVDLDGIDKPVTACNTTAPDGAIVATRGGPAEAARKTIVGALAMRYKGQSNEGELGAAITDNEFLRWVGRLGLDDQVGIEPPGEAPPVDDAHPYIRVDMARCITCFRCVRICAELQGQFTWQVWGRGESTRIVPDSGGSLADSSCVSCGACADTCPSGALTDKSLVGIDSPITWTRTTCEYCGTGCELEAGVVDGQLTASRPVLDAPVSKGHLCSKGRYAHGYVHADDRVTSPMIREKGGDWREVSWPEALKQTANRLRAIVDRDGADALGVLGSARGTNEESYLAQKLTRLVLGTNNVDCCARVCHAPTAAAMSKMIGTGAATNSFDDIEEARAFLLIGANPTENHPIVGARIRQQVLAGAELIVIDPRRIELAEIATIHLAPRPGTDMALLNGLAHVIVAEGLTDDEFAAERVTGSDEFREFIAAFTPESVEAITGVAASDIRRAAELYATTRPTMAFHGLGMTEHLQGTEQVMAIVNLALLTGNLGKAGSGVNPLRGQNNVQGSAHMGCEPKRLTGYVPLDEGRERFERVWGAEIPNEPGANLMEMLDLAAEGRMKALWLIGYDVYLSSANESSTAAAFEQLDEVIVQDLFMTESAREFGTVFLPASSAFERDGTFMNSERRIQRIRKSLEPVGESRPDWQIICDVAREMGHGEQFDFTSPEEVWNEIRQVWLVGSGIDYERLESGGIQWPCPDEDSDGTRVLHKQTFAKSDTAELARIDFVESPETTDSEHPLVLVTGRSLFQFNAGTMTMRTPNETLRPTDTLDISAVDADGRGIVDGDLVKVRSRHGEMSLPARIDDRVKAGEVYATFQDPARFVNKVTSRQRDRIAGTPEFKRTAVQVTKG